MKRVKPAQKTKSISVRCSEEAWEKLEKLALREGKSKGEVIDEALALKWDDKYRRGRGDNAKAMAMLGKFERAVRDVAEIRDWMDGVDEEAE